MNEYNYVDNGVARKIKNTNLISYQDYFEAGKKYLEHLQKSVYSAIVFDYDKTIHNKHKKTETEEKIRNYINYLLEKDITICVATGNGEYIASNLREYFEEKHHSKIVVGYYNGGIISTLDKNIKINNDTMDTPLDFQRVKSFYEKEIPRDCIHEEGLWCEQNPYELNFYPIDENTGAYYFNKLKN